MLKFMNLFFVFEGNIYFFLIEFFLLFEIENIIKKL